MTAAEKIKVRALTIGFDLVGITTAEHIPQEDRQAIRDWLDSGCAGEMAYMSRNFKKRVNPAELLDGAKSVIVVALNYKSAEQIPTSNQLSGTVARYARYEDYHIFMKDFLRKLARFIINEIDETAGYKICVDSVPLAERALAVRAGLGFIGSNHMLINPDLGPELFLGELITTLELDVDKPSLGNCQKCDKCIKACPTGALQADGTFDARKCISYLTIEYKGSIEPEVAKKTGDRVFGCDECVLACPYQQKGKVCLNSEIKFYPERAFLNLNEIIEMDEDCFKTRFQNSPFERPGLDILKRNARICIENLKGISKYTQKTIRKSV